MKQNQPQIMRDDFPLIPRLSFIQTGLISFLYYLYQQNISLLSLPNKYIDIIQL